MSKKTQERAFDAMIGSSYKHFEVFSGSCTWSTSKHMQHLVDRTLLSLLTIQIPEVTSGPRDDTGERINLYAFACLAQRAFHC